MSTGLADGRRSKPVERHTALYQCGAQTPSNGLGPVGQASISARRRCRSASHNALSVAARIAQNVVGIDHRRRLAQLIGDEVEDLRLLDEADIAERDRRPFLGIAREHALGRADQEGIGHPVDQVRSKPGSMWCVMCF